MRRALILALIVRRLAARRRRAGRAADRPTVPDRVEELQQELDSLTEDVEDLQEPVAEFELFESACT